MSETKRMATEQERARVFALAELPSDRLLLHMIWDQGLTVAETAGLTWGEVDGRRLRLRGDGRSVPLEPGTEEALAAARAELRKWTGREPRPETPVFPGSGEDGAPVSRMTVSRRVRALLDRAGLKDVHPKELKEQYILRQLERRPIEEVSRISGVETRTLGDIWGEYGREGSRPPRKTARRSGADPAALEAALAQEGDSLDARVIRLSWQGGLTVREMRTLRWSELPEDFSVWSPGGRSRPIPEALRPWLEQWRAADRTRGADCLTEGVRGKGPGELSFLTRRANEFLIRRGMEDVTLVRLRGGGLAADAGARSALLEYARKRGRFRLTAAARRLGLPPLETRRLTEALWAEGLLEPEGKDVWRLSGGETARERLEGVLEKERGRTVTAGALRERSGIPDSRLHYFIREALAEGRLRRVSRGTYLVPGDAPHEK